MSIITVNTYPKIAGKCAQKGTVKHSLSFLHLVVEKRRRGGGREGGREGRGGGKERGKGGRGGGRKRGEGGGRGEKGEEGEEGGRRGEEEGGEEGAGEIIFLLQKGGGLID